MGKWTLFSNHGHVLVCLVNDPESRLRDVAVQVGITERAVQKIVRDLQDVGMLSVTKDGRRNRYRIDKSQALRHQLESHCTIADLISFIQQTPAENKQTPDDIPAEESPSATIPMQEEQPAPVPEPVAEPPVEQQTTPSPPADEQEIEKQEIEKKENADAEAVSLVEKQQGSLF